MRFSLVDRIETLEPRQSLTAVKALSLAEEYLADHFPGFPVMPGVLMLEALVQSGAWLLRATEDFKFSTVLLKEARGLKFNSFVRPGGTLHLKVNVHKWGETDCVLKGEGTIEGASAVKARITLTRFNLADKNPELQDSDERQVAAMRELFEQIRPRSNTAA